MKKERLKQQMEDMYNELNDPVKLAEAQRKYQIKKHLSDNKKDTGL